MRGKATWLVLAALFVVVLASTPAQAAWPERYSMGFFDAAGFFIDCIDFGRCQGGKMPATAFLAGKSGSCDCPDEFEPARHRMSCTWNNVDWSFFAPGTRQVDMDVTCSRWGSPFYFLITPGPGSCGAGVTYRRIDQFGLNVTFQEGYSGATIGRPFRCSDLFTVATPEQIEELDFRDLLKSRR